MAQIHKWNIAFDFSGSFTPKHNSFVLKTAADRENLWQMEISLKNVDVFRQDELDADVAELAARGATGEIVLCDAEDAYRWYELTDGKIADRGGFFDRHKVSCATMEVNHGEAQ